MGSRFLVTTYMYLDPYVCFGMFFVIYWTQHVQCISTSDFLLCVLSLPGPIGENRTWLEVNIKGADPWNVIEFAYNAKIQYSTCC